MAFGRKMVFLAVTLASIVLMLVCVKFDNPLDPDVNNPYYIRLDIDSTKTYNLYTPVTCSIYQNPQFPYDSIIVEGNIDAPGDTAFLSSMKNDRSQVTLYFLQVKQHRVIIRAVRPNKRVDMVSYQVKVENPFKLHPVKKEMILAVKELATLSVVKNGDPVVSASDSVRWIRSIGDSLRDTLTLTAQRKFSFTDTVVTRITVDPTYIDSLGHKLRLERRVVSFMGVRPVLDRFSIQEDVIGLDRTMHGYINLKKNRSGRMQVFAFDLTGEWKSDPTLFFPGDSSGLMEISPPMTGDTGRRIIYAFVKSEQTQLVSDTLFDSVRVVPNPPQLFFTENEDTLIIPTNKNFTITAKQNGGSKAVEYQFTANSKDTVTDGPQWTSVFLHDTGECVVVTVCGKDKYGFTGKRDSLVLRGGAFAYDLQFDPVPSPFITTPYPWPQWRVHSSDSSEAFNDKAFYYWRISDGTSTILQDSGKTLTAVTCKLMNDRDLYIRVVLREPATKKSSVTLNRLCRTSFTPFKARFDLIPPYQNGTGQQIAFSMLTDDSSISTEKYRWIISDQLTNIKVIDSTTGATTPAYSVRFKTPGKLQMRAFMVDTFGRFSDTLKYSFIVTVAKPSLDWEVFPTVAYMKHDTTFSVRTSPNQLTQAALDSLYWDVDGDTTVWEAKKPASDSTFTCSFRSYGTSKVTVKCIDKLGNDTVVARSIRIKRGEPRIISFSVDTTKQYTNIPVTFSMAGIDTNGVIGRWQVWASGKLIKDTSAINGAVLNQVLFQTAFADTGWKRITMVAFDNDTIASDTFVRENVVHIVFGAPFIDSLAANGFQFTDKAGAAFVWSGKPNVMRIYYHDSNYGKRKRTVVNIIAKWGKTSDTVNLPGASPLELTHAFTCGTDTASVDTVVISAKDDEKLQVSRKFLVRIRNSTPRISGFVKPAKVWIKDNNQYLLKVFDPDDSSLDYRISWGDGTSGSGRITDTAAVKTLQLDHAYPISVKDIVYRISISVTDGIKQAATLTDSTTVYLGAPMVVRFVPLQKENWAQDSTMRYRIVYGDPNDSVKRLVVKWGDNTARDTLLVAGKQLDSVETSHSFSRIEDQVNQKNDTISVVAIDIDSIASISYDTTLVVKRGEPTIVLDSLISSDSLWIRDVNRYRFTAADPNGKVTRICVSWAGTGVVDDSITVVKPATDNRYRFVHAFADTMPKVKRSIQYWAYDDKGNRSAIGTAPITVHLGAPVLWGNTADTLWAIIDTGIGIYPFSINSLDSNGKVVQYYWNFNKPGIEGATATANNTFTTRFSLNDINKSQNMYVYGRDDDSLVAGGQFVLFADSIPPQPEATWEPSKDTVYIAWKKKDAKDQNKTQYQILLRVDSVASFDTLKDQAGELYTKYPNANYDFKFRIPREKIKAGKKYWYMVIAKDARKSINKSDPGSFTAPSASLLSNGRQSGIAIAEQPPVTEP